MALSGITMKTAKMYRLKKGILGQHVDAAQKPTLLSRWLKQGTQLVVLRDKYYWPNGEDFYFTIRIARRLEEYNVVAAALEPAMEEIERV
jgi:hypothetical protein